MIKLSRGGTIVVLVTLPISVLVMGTSDEPTFAREWFRQVVVVELTLCHFIGVALALLSLVLFAVKRNPIDLDAQDIGRLGVQVMFLSALMLGAVLWRM